MLINNSEALKSWLIVILEPLCDADSSALARYVLALLKKDKPENELKRVMIEQLDVFLGEETKPFVERLFDAINTEEYLVIPAPPPPAVGDLSAAAAAGDEESSSTVATVHAESSSAGGVLPPSTAAQHMLSTQALDEMTKEAQQQSHKVSDVTDRSSSTQIQSVAHTSASSYAGQQHLAVLPHHQARSASSPTPSIALRNAITATAAATTSSNALADKENLPRESRRRRASLRSRSRSRSRSNERLSRRSRSRDRRPNNNNTAAGNNSSNSSSNNNSNNNNTEREKVQRQFRNKSPPPLSMDARHDRRRVGGGGGGGSGGGGGDRRGRLGGGADERSPRFGSGSGKARTNRSHTRSRSPTPGMERNSGRKPGLVATPERHHHQQQQLQQQQQPQHLQQAHLVDSEKRQRCRDFDEKGYCVRGETCPWDHGINPVVFEDINNSALISISLREYNPDVPELWSRSSANTSAATPATAMLTGGGAGVGGAIGGAGVLGGINPFTGTPRPGSVMMGGGPGYPHLVGGGGGSGGVIVDNNNKILLANGAAAAAASEYARSAAAVAGFRAAAAGGPMIPFPFNPVATPLQRELIPIPVVDATNNSGGNMGASGGDIGALQQQQQNKRRYELEDTVAIADGPPPPTAMHKRKVPLNSRLGPRMNASMMMQTNCSLELRKVPRGLNTIAHLNNHFAKFGKIINIQISYDGDPEAAIVTFSTHAEANVAYRSTEAVLNNRFIKVFWHSQDTSSGNDGSGMGGGGGMGGPRKSSQYHLNNVPAAVPTPSADSAKTFNAAGGGSSSQGADAANESSATPTANAPGGQQQLAATHAPTPAMMRLKNNVVTRGGTAGAQQQQQPGGAQAAAANANSIRKKQEEQAKAVVQLANGLRKRKQELLQSYVKQMKSALELVERCEPQDGQRAKTLATIKMLQENIDKLHKEIAAEQEQQMQVRNNNNNNNNNSNQEGGIGVPPPPKKTKEQQKKELLDIELELFAQQQEGNDTSAIQKRLEELQRSLGVGAGITAGNAATGGKAAHFAATQQQRMAQAARGGRGNYHNNNNAEVSTRVDRRPKTIVVTGFTGDEADFVLGHFKHFGEISKHDVDKEIPQLILSYATRMSAEQAVLRGKIFKDKRLQIAWAPTITPKPIINAPTTPLSDNSKSDADKLATSAAAVAVVDADTPIIDLSKHQHEMDLVAGADTLPELRLEDEEEEDECEDRSWRR